MLSTCEIDSISQFPRPIETTQIELTYIKELHWFDSNSKFTNISGKQRTEQKLCIAILICLAICGMFQHVFTSESYIPRKIEAKKNIEDGMSKNSVLDIRHPPDCLNKPGIAIKLEILPKTETDIIAINVSKIKKGHDSPDNLCRTGKSEVQSETEPESMNSDVGLHDPKQDDIKSQETEHLDKNSDIKPEYKEGNQHTDTKIEQSDNNFAAENYTGSKAEPVSKLNGHQVEETSNKSEKREIQKHRSSSTVQKETSESIPPENTRAVLGDFSIINEYIDIRTKPDVTIVTANYIGLENGHIGSENSPQTEKCQTILENSPGCWGGDLRSDRTHGQKQGDVSQIHSAGNDVINIRSELDDTRSKFPQQIQQSDTRLENKAKNIDTKNKIYTAEKKQDSLTVDTQSFIHRTDLIKSEQNNVDNENQYGRSSNDVVVLNDPQLKHTVNKSEKVEMPRHRSPSTVLKVEEECMSTGARCLNEETELYKATASPSIDKSNYSESLWVMLLEKENVKTDLEIKKLKLEIELLNKKLTPQPHQFKK